VFLLLFAYFGIPVERRPRLLFWGILVAIAVRGIAILGGVAIIEQFHFVIYVLGATLLVLAYRIFRGGEEKVDPGKNLMVRLVRRLYPVAEDYEGPEWFVKLDGRRHVTPLFLCLVAIVFTDIAFAIDSLPAAFGITRDAFLIWIGNAFALLGLRALFVLIEALLERFRYFDETIAIVLGVVAVKLLIEDLYKIPPELSLVLVLGLLTGGILASVAAERREARAARVD
jgi:tellurite resistance protein TerC